MTADLSPEEETLLADYRRVNSEIRDKILHKSRANLSYAGQLREYPYLDPDESEMLSGYRRADGQTKALIRQLSIMW